MGYDPIFRQQAAAAAVNSLIQPAPAGQSTASSTPALSAAVLHSASNRLANSYGSQPSMLPSTYAPSPTASLSSAPASRAAAPGYAAASPAAAASAAAAVPPKAEPAYEYSSAARQESSAYELSSGLDGSRHVSATSLSENSPPKDSGHPNQGERSRREPCPCARAAPAPPPPLACADAPPPPPANKNMKIKDIIDLLGPPPPVQPVAHSADTFNEITKVYHEMYAGALSSFFETTWYYFAENGKMTFPRNANLVEQMAFFLRTLEAVKANDHAQMAYSGVLETRIVWELACTAYVTPDRSNSALRLALPPEGDAAEARNRLRVVETLLCGECLPANPLAPPVADHDQHRTRQFDFWYSLAEFVRSRDSPASPQAVKAREDMLSRMRHLLDGRENRDVLYSIAVVRELAPNFDAGLGAAVAQHLDETDPKSRLAVASKFILDEAQVTGGTTNVVRRFSDIAVRAFVNPGVNVAGRA